MKKVIRFAGLLMLMVLARAEAKDPVAGVLPANYGEVVFVRQESEGSLNILPSRITCEMWERVVLLGGAAGSVYLAEGEYEFQVFSREPHELESDPTACRSAALRVSVRKGKKTFVEVIPQPADEKLKFHWLLKERKG